MENEQSAEDIIRGKPHWFSMGVVAVEWAILEP